ncbi:hypothetical protein AB0N05_00665 [Nocardia sp. NPDC051030]|uniref:DUF7373 family lipoprotein n=1 Tax=Nocardia sp. NPDC051030 TaxID=3155162 RepID=UPI00341304D5
MAHAARVFTAVTCLALTALLTGCGTKGTPVAAEMDVRTLDSGTYPVNRFTYDRNSNGNGATLEGMRMADAVAPAVKIDPSLKVGRGGVVLSSVADVVSVSRLSSSAKPVLANRGFIAGYANSGADMEDPAGKDTPDPNSTSVTLRLLRFPSADSAKLAAKELEDADFNVALNQNQKLTMPEYPDAFAHWRPNVGNIGVTMARKEFVISVFLARPTVDKADLLSWAKKTLDAEVPAVDAFAPTPADKVDQLPVDPDRLLARALVADRDNRKPDQDNFAVYGPNWMIGLAGDMALRTRLFTDTGMDQMAVADDTLLFRVRDAKAGADLVAGLILSLNETSAGAPDKVPEVKCVHHKSGDINNRCYVIYKRYVAGVSAGTEAEAQKMAAAQYTLLANSL